MIRVPRVLIVGLAALFSGYHVVLALYSLAQGDAGDAAPVAVAIVLYLGATVVVLFAGRRTVIPLWAAAVAVGVALSMVLLVASTLDPAQLGDNRYGTWYVAAVGTMLTIVMTRRRPAFAWAGIAILVAHTAVWAGPAALGPLGVIGSAIWVMAAHVMSGALAKAARDSERFALAEREAAEWQAAQEAHLNERQIRLGQTSAMALPMLRVIQRSGGELSQEQRSECWELEGAIRDEIRGRRLLDDEVREQVRLARRRGAEVALLDEGGIDDLDEGALSRVHAAIASALRGVVADKLIVRTVEEGSAAVTVVGLRSHDGGSVRMLGQDEEDEVTLWLEVPR